MDDNGWLASSDKGVGDPMNAFFASVFTKENTDHFPAVKQQFYGEEYDRLCNFNITADIIKSKLGKLKMNKAPGVDSIGSKMLLELSKEISGTVAERFIKYLSSGDVPNDWKLANVTAILKGEEIKPFKLPTCQFDSEFI